MDDLEQLNQQFGLPGVLRFSARGALPRAEVTLPQATATVFLQGAHVAHWQPAGAEPVLFLSSRTDLRPGKAIRGGIPVVAPWFGPDTEGRDGGQPGPSHGFARTQPWQVVFAAMAGEDLHLTLALGPTPLSRSLGYPNLHLALQIAIGAELRLQLAVGNNGAEPVPIEDALHTYLAVGDVRQVGISGLGGTEFLDKTDGMRQKQQTEAVLNLTGETDRVYLHTDSTCVVDDPVSGRRLVVAKTNSRSTVVWNPWEAASAKLADMEPGGWERMLCVETANTSADAISIAPGTTHTMGLTLSVAPFPKQIWAAQI